jgi:hypothetical protein
MEFLDLFYMRAMPLLADFLSEETDHIHTKRIDQMNMEDKSEYGKAIECSRALVM